MQTDNRSFASTAPARMLRRARSGTALLLTGFLLAATLPDADAARPPHAGPKPANSINAVPTITSIEVVDGQLVASGFATALIHGRAATATFTDVPVNISLASPGDVTIAAACPILNLELGPINLDLLGLVVETSPICLQITAYENEGLLGDLLCAVANLLNGGLSLDDILAGQGLVVDGLVVLPGLTPNQIDQLLGGLTDLLNEALGNLLDAILGALLPGVGSCDILYLELGPLNLTLLGLEVILDDCEGGPVVVEITGEQGRGNLLGNVLCGLLGGGLIDLGATLEDILNQLLGELSQ